MASTPSPLSQLLTINDQNVSDVEGISDLLQDAPFLAAILADVASNGTDHKYLKETKAPVVGFRAINDGRDHDHSLDTMVTIALKILDASFHVDQALADEYKFGAAAWIARESQRHIRASFAEAELQLINGTGNQAGGFTGLIDASTIDALADPMVIDGGQSAGNVTSVYAVRSVPANTDLLLIVGNEGRISVGDSYSQMMAGATGLFNAYVTPIYSHLALQLGSIHSIGRICNLDAANPLDDVLISSLLATFPPTRMATHLVMNQVSLAQLQASRTATNPTGAPAPFPQSAFNVPIITTNSVLTTETALA